MNNIKLFMLLIMAATSSVAIADETPSVDWSIVGNGSTLTISGYGDLTNASKSDWKTVFSTAAYGNVFFNNEGGGVDVEENFLYFPNSTYYEATHTWSGPLFNGGVPTNGDKVNNVTSSTSWKTNVDGVNLYPVFKATSTKTEWYSSNNHIYHVSGVSKVWDSEKTAPEAGNVYIYEVTSSKVENEQILTIGSRVITGTPLITSWDNGIQIEADSYQLHSRYYLSTSELESGTTLKAAEVYNNLLKDDNQIDAFCKYVVTIDDNTDYNKTEVGSYSAINHDNVQYAPFVLTEETHQSGDVLSVEDLIEESNKTSYQRSYYPIIFDYDNAGKVSSSAAYPYSIGTFTIGDDSYVNYAIFDQAYTPATAFAPDDSRMTLLTSLSEYTNSSTTYVCASDNLYRSQDGGTTKTKLTNGTTYNYTAGDLFYTSTGVEYSAIPNNEEYFSLHSNYIEQRKIAHTFKHDLLAAMHEGETTYTKVVFVNSSTADDVAMIIDPEIVQAILFPHKETEYSNSTITELDLGQATTTSFDHLLDHPTKAYLCPVNLANVTLPLVATVANEVVLPANVIPGVYNGSSANLRTVTVPEGYTKIGDSAFKVYDDHTPFGSTQITTINLPTTLKEIGDEAFIRCSGLSNLNISDPTKRVAGRSIVLPASLTKIGKSAFAGCTSLTSTASDPFILPADLETIMPYAFLNLKEIKFLKLNSKLKFVGNSAFCCDAAVNDQTTIVFPASIAYLGPSAFGNRRYQDIYFTGTTAPVCPVGKGYYYDDQTAFYGELQMANNGFDPVGLHDGSHAGDTSQGYANRENYINNGCYFTMLHFPANISSDNAKTYKDITRKYVTNFVLNETTGKYEYAGYGSKMTLEVAQETAASVFQYNPPHGGTGYYTDIDAKTVNPGFIDTYLGEQCIWPSQSQWNRYYNLVANGYEWNGEDTYRPTVTDDMIAYMILDNLQIYNNNTNNQYDIVFGSKSYDTQTLYSDLTEEQKTALKAGYLSQILYQGTRRFVLSNDGSFPIPFDITMQGGMWWTICLPFNVTKKMVDDVFGVGTHVCLFSGVDRITTGDTKSLVLKFKNDVYQHKTVRTREEITSNGAIVGYKYNYGSDFSYSKTAPTDDDDVIMYAHESYMIYPKKNNDDPSAVRSFTDPIMVEGDPLPTKIQANASSDAPYDINAESGNPVYRFIGSYVTSAGGKDMNMKVPQYSYVFAKKKNDSQRKFYMYNGTTSKWVAFKSVVQNTAVGGGLEDWTNFFGSGAAKVNEVSLFGDEEEVTGIDNVIIEVSSDNDEDLRVFNLNGSMMGNSLQGLPAGTYIQGGKAYRVK